MKTFVEFLLVALTSVMMATADGVMRRFVGASRSGSILWVGGRDGSAYVSFDRSQTWMRVHLSTQEVVGPRSAGREVLWVTPNPAWDRVEVSFRLVAAGHREIVVYDMNGRVVVRVPRARYSPGEQRVVVDLSSVLSGSYIVVVRSDSDVGKGIILQVTR